MEDPDRQYAARFNTSDFSECLPNVKRGTSWNTKQAETPSNR